MRILHLSHGLYPDRVGGVEVHTYELARALSTVHEVTVLARSSGPSREFTRDGVLVHQVRADEKDPSGMRRTITKIEDLLRTSAPDLVHIQHLGLSDLPALAIFERIRMARLPCVLSLHDYWYMCPRHTLVDWHGMLCPGPTPARCGRCADGWPTKNPWRWYARYRRQVVRQREFMRLLSKCSVIAPVSDHVARRYLTFGLSRARMLVVAPGIRVPLTRAGEPITPAERLVVAYLGQVLPEKGVAVLVKALGRMRAAADLEVWGRGRASFTEQLAREARALAVRATFHGAYAQDTLDQILAAAHVVVVPSEWEEPFGLVVQEALARRRIVVVSRVGGLPEQVLQGVNGYLVPPGDPPRLAEALDRVAAGLGAGSSRCGTLPSGVGLGVRAIEKEAAEWSRIYALAVAHQGAPEVAATEFEMGAAISAIANSLGAARREILMDAVRLRAGQGKAGRTFVERHDEPRSQASALLAHAIAEHDPQRRMLRREASAALHARGIRRVVIIGGDLGLDALELSALGLEVTVLEPNPVRADVMRRRLLPSDGTIGVLSDAREASGAEAVFVPGLVRPSDDDAHFSARILDVDGLLVTAQSAKPPTGFLPEVRSLTAEASLSLWRRR